MCSGFQSQGWVLASSGLIWSLWNGGVNQALSTVCHRTLSVLWSPCYFLTSGLCISLNHYYLWIQLSYPSSGAWLTESNGLSLHVLVFCALGWFCLPPYWAWPCSATSLSLFSSLLSPQSWPTPGRLATSGGLRFYPLLGGNSLGSQHIATKKKSYSIFPKSELSFAIIPSALLSETLYSGKLRTIPEVQETTEPLSHLRIKLGWAPFFFSVLTFCFL